MIVSMMNSNKPKTIGIIPARYASTRFPGKLLKEVAGKTILQHTFENAKRCPLIDELIVATDDLRIAKNVKDFNGRVVMTSPSCPTGTDRLVEAVQNNPDLQNCDMIINIQGDEPCMEVEVITKVIEALQNDDLSVMSTAVVPIETEEEALNPSVVKCVINEEGHALYFSRGLIPHGKNGKFHTEKTYYQHIGIYCFRPDFLLHYTSLTPTPLQLAEDLEQLKVLEHGYHIHVAIVDSHTIGVDTPEDLKKVEKKLCNRNTFS